jgi:hypothetical protein
MTANGARSQGFDMTWFRHHRSAIALAILVVVIAAALAGCARDTGPVGGKVASHEGSYPPPGETQKAPEPRPVIPPRLSQSELVGRWGYASYLRIEDKERTIAAAEKSCGNPYLIGEGAHGGLVMHLADEREPRELALKGSSGASDYIGPEGPAGGEKDREITFYDGRVLILRFVSPEISSRYGMSVYAKCSSVEPLAREAPEETPEPATRKSGKKARLSQAGSAPAVYLPNEPE